MSHFHPFVPPAVKPETKNFWNIRKRMVIGIAIKTDPAAKVVNSLPNWFDTISNNPTP